MYFNYFYNRSTNASAESFNAKIKAFRAQFKGMRNIQIFYCNTYI
ncbi:transposase [Polaribacter sp. ALD11]|nr:transposase [Polaribacter sp. ALD11]